MAMLEIMVWVGGGILFYNLVAAGLSRAIQPLRLHVVDSIEDLKGDETIPLQIHNDLDFLADSLFSSYRAWLIVVTLPVVAIHSWFSKSAGESPVAIKNHARRKEIVSTYVLGTFCMIAKSPLCLVLFALEFLLLVVLPVRYGRATRRAVHAAVGIDSHLGSHRWAS